MKIIIKIFLWISMIFNGGVSIFLLLTSWGPLYLVTIDEGRYNWIGLIGVFFQTLIGFIISLILYKHIVAYKSNIFIKNSLIIGTFTIIQLFIVPFCNYLANITYSSRFESNFSFDSIFIWSNLLPLGYLMILIIYPKLIKKYYLKK